MKKHFATNDMTIDMPFYDHEPVSSPNMKQSETSKLEKKVNELTKQVEMLSQKSKKTTHVLSGCMEDPNQHSCKTKVLCYGGCQTGKDQSEHNV